MKLRTLASFTLLLTAVAIGCAGRPSILPNADKQLRKTSAQFAADAAKRHPFKADAPSGGEIASRAQVDYAFDFLDIANLSDTDWTDAEVWLNDNYVVALPSLAHGKLVRLPFQMFFDDSGNNFPTKNTAVRVSSVKLYKDGKMYSVTAKLAD